MVAQSNNRPQLEGEKRAEKAHLRRNEATILAGDKALRPNLRVPDNGDNDSYDKAPMAFTKGLQHDEYGFATRADYDGFVDALNSVDGNGIPDRHFSANIASNTSRCSVKRNDASEYARISSHRAWESPLTGGYFDLQGPDADAVAMAPAPKFGESELCAEMVEVYAMALVRDMTFEQLQNLDTVLSYDNGEEFHLNDDGSKATVQDLIKALNSLNWHDEDATVLSTLAPDKGDAELSAHEGTRRRTCFTEQTLFRSRTSGNCEGGYISQFMTLGTMGSASTMIEFGTNAIDQRVRRAKAGIDYMTSWPEWLDVQDGIDMGGLDKFENFCALISTPRDLATYVHFDQLYQAYFNACLILLKNNFPADEGFPDKGKPKDDKAEGKQEKPSTRFAFASFGGPHILSLMTEVSSRALRAVRRQKFQIHRRARPERLAAMVTLAANGHGEKLGSAQGAADRMLAELGIGGHEATGVTPILRWISNYNAWQNGECVRKRRKIKCENPGNVPEIAADANYLLPMAFPEGSPMHPAYGAGHATVAGACVTVLKAFFDTANGAMMDCIEGGDGTLSVEGELNKLAANISIGRNFAGVHYYSDYFDSLRMGERIAVGMLQEQLLAYNEDVSMTLNSFDGDRIVIGTDGSGRRENLRTSVEGKTGISDFAEWWARPVVEFEQQGARQYDDDAAIAEAKPAKGENRSRPASRPKSA